MTLRLAYAICTLALIAMVGLLVFGPKRTIMVHWCYSPKGATELVCKDVTEREYEVERRKIFPEQYK